MEKGNLGILTFPLGKTGIIPTSNLVDIICSFSNNVHLVTGNEGYTYFKKDKRIHTHGIKHIGGANVFMRIITYLFTQLKISGRLVKIRKNIDIWFFFIGGDCLILPMLTAKMLGKKTVLAFAGSATLTLEYSNDSFFKFSKLLSNINCSLSDRIIIYSPNLIKEWGLERFKNKIRIAHKHFLDLKRFKLKKEFDDRDDLVGYIGRLSEEKGVMNFVKAIPKILKEKKTIRFLIAGDGQLLNKIKSFIKENNLTNKVNLVGWIPHENLSEYLNELKLLVLPSYTEGLPNIMLEAMACGTPVLVNSIGAIPDFVTDEQTGFIMDGNSPECIVKNVVKVLSNPNLNAVANNERDLVKKEFTFTSAVERYKKIINEI